MPNSRGGSKKPEIRGQIRFSGTITVRKPRFHRQLHNIIIDDPPEPDKFAEFADWVRQQRGEVPPETLGGGPDDLWTFIKTSMMEAYRTLGSQKEIDEYLKIGKSCHGEEDLDE